MLPPLVDRSVEIFLSTKTLKEIFNAFLQSLISRLDFAVAINLLLLTVTDRSYISFNRSSISAFESSFLFPFEDTYTSTFVSAAVFTPVTEMLPPEVCTSLLFTNYSVFRLLAGFAIAAFIACELTTRIVIISAQTPADANTHQDIPIR